MDAHDPSDAAVAALAGLPWVRTADRLPPDSVGRCLVLIAPTPYEPDDGSVEWLDRSAKRHRAEIAVAMPDEGGRWLRNDLKNGSLWRTPIRNAVVAWIDVDAWELDRVIDRLEGIWK